MSSNLNNFPFPTYPSPPPPHPHAIPPPSPLPPAQPHPHPAPFIPPPPPQPDHHDYIIIIVIPVVGCIFLAMAVFALCFYMKKRNKKRAVQETDIKHIDEHLRVEEAIVTDSHGRKKTVVLSVKDDVHVDEDIIKHEKEFGASKSKEVSSAGDLEAGQSSSGANVAKLGKS